MFRGARKFLILGLSVLVIAVLVALIITQDNGTSKLRRHIKTPAKKTIVDRTPYRTAIALQTIASTAEEQELASQAVQLSDREIDIAFASALRRAKETPPPQSKEISDINQRIKSLGAHLQTEQAEVDKLTQLAAKPGKYDAGILQQQLEIGKAQVTLLRDALDDAKEDLIRAGGDPEALVQQELKEHESNIQHGNTNAVTPTKPQNFAVGGNLLSEFRTWTRMRENHQRLLDAQQQADTLAATLTSKHEALEKGIGDSDQWTDFASDTTPAPSSADNSAQQSSKLAKLQSLSQNTKTLAAYDKRIDLEKQLAAVYGDWAAIVAEQIRIAMHAILRSLLWIVLALLCLVIAEGAIERFYVRLGPDRRRLSTARLTMRFIAQTLGVLVILLVLFGPPSQLSTVLALAGAGLTVALKDFIVAFFGWFILMGKNGIRVGDWVEIDGIGGEVLDVGLLRTILLETGNWNDAGHPTGRRVSFVNSFAIEGHYFNFTTAGQWLWDELNILIPAGEDPYELTKSVMKLVTDNTQADTQQAEQEWQRVTHNSAIQTFSAVPAIEVRPTNLGVNLVVRYIARAHERHEVRTKLYQAIVELLHTKRVEAVNAGRVTAQ